MSAPFALLRPTGDGVTRVLITRQAQDGTSVDLSLLSVDAAGGAPTERLLAANLPSGFNVNCATGAQACSAGRSRLIVLTASDPVSGDRYARIDPLSGDRLDFAGYYIQSASAERLLVYPTTPDAPATLYEPDDSVVHLDAGNFQFVGETLYYLTREQGLMRSSVGVAPELVATNVTFFMPSPSPDDPWLLIGRPTTTPDVVAASILDAATGDETPLPADIPFYGIFISPDGQWIAAQDWKGNTIQLIDRTGAVRTSFMPTSPAGMLTWRPGHPELWVDDESPQPAIWILRPDLPPQHFEAFPFNLTDATGPGAGSIFTGDGRYWFSSAVTFTDTALQVGSADDPTGPRVRLVPDGAHPLVYWPLPDGRLLVEAWTATPEINNVLAVDAQTGEAQVVGEQGLVLAVGQTRVVVNQHLVNHEGDLAVFDLGNAHTTVLAREFTIVALIEPRGEDPAAPGAQIVFRFQARFPSPYDGVWLATIP